MTTVHEYVTLNPAQRDRIRSAVRDVAVRTNERYADLLAAEAVLTARAVYPDTHRLVFRLGEDVTGTTATLVAAYDRAGGLLWHVDRDGEWPDESQVSDLLAAAVDWYDGHYPVHRRPRGHRPRRVRTARRGQRTTGTADRGWPVNPAPLPTHVGTCAGRSRPQSASNPSARAVRWSSWSSSTAAKARRVTGSRCWRCMCGPTGS